MDDSPPPFIVFRTPSAPAAPTQVYELALDFTANVERVLQRTEARYFLKDRLDRNASGIAMHVAHARSDRAPSARRASYRKAHALAVECATVLDILARRSDVEPAVVSEARRVLAQLLTNLDHLRGEPV